VEIFFLDPEFLLASLTLAKIIAIDNPGVPAVSSVSAVDGVPG